ncbi:hypothetical protein QP028_11085 [Corynebacterium suedekumii]|nr:hypothetical protein QP028_11085 [Corynebacterium suedekumii]
MTKETPSGLRKQIDRKRHHPETATARARTLARGEAARAAAAEQGYDLNTREAQALLGRDPRSLTALAQAGHLHPRQGPRATKRAGSTSPPRSWP